MELSTSSNHVTIKGNIKTVSDFQDIKNCLDSMKTQYDSIVISILDSLSITSSVIGYLSKLALKDTIGLSLRVGNPQLMNLLDDLQLSSTFNISRT